MNELRDVTPKRKDLSMPRRRRMRRRSIALALAAATALTCAGVPGFAQQAPPTTGGGLAAPAATQPATTQGAATRPANANGHITTQPGGGMLLNFKEASIDSVLDELSTAAGFIVIKEVQRLEGRVTLVSKQPVKPDEAVPLLNSVLKNAGYAAIQQGRVLKILQRDKAKRANIPVRVGSDPTKIPDTDELITQVIPLKSADAQQLRQDLTPLIDTSTADFTSNASSNSLVITDTSANIRRVAMIVSAMDSSIIDNATVKVMQLQHAAAATAAKLILEVFGEQANPQQGGNRGGNPFRQFFGGGGPFGGGGGGPFGGGGGGGPFGGGGGGADGGGRGGGRGDGAGGAAARRATPRVTASSDDRTNTLIVSGPTDTIAVIERVVKELDADPAAEETVFIYRLKNAQALNVESVMNSLFNGTTSGNRGSSTLNAGTNRTSSIQRGGSGRGGSSGGLGGSGSSFGGRGGGLQATGGGFNGGGGGVNRGGGGFGGGGFGLSSNASRTAADLSGQVTIIADPDTNSMLIRTKPGNYERVKAVLAELDRAVGQVLIKVLVAEVTHDNSTDIGAEFSVLNLRPSGNGQKGGTNFGLARLQSGLVAQILEDNFTATIRALENVGKLDVLSRPYILASDNQLASITVGQEIPFITNSRITDTGQTINSVEYDDIGILLDVIPHINEDGLVILDVAPEISALTGTQIPISDTVSSPVIAKRSAQTRIAIQDGQTVVIGGLMEDRKTETIDKVPFLGDIPIAGELFKRTQNKKTKTELLIFLTPHVAAQPTQLKEMSRQEIQGSKLVPRAVDPNAFEEHRQGLELGQPNPPADGTAPDAPKPDAPKKEPRQ